MYFPNHLFSKMSLEEKPGIKSLRTNVQLRQQKKSGLFCFPCLLFGVAMAWTQQVFGDFKD